jgi:hypothetical protein
MRCLLAVLTLVLGILPLAAQPASAAVAVHLENRASGSAAVADTLGSQNTRLSDEAVRENITLRYDLASDSPVAVEGVTAADGTGMAFAGHGVESSFLGTTIVPEGTTIMIPGESGLLLPQSVGLQMEAGDLSAASALEGSTTYLPGAEIPNLLLRPMTDLPSLPNSITVTVDTSLSQLLRPGMGNVCWAACRFVPGQ